MQINGASFHSSADKTSDQSLSVEQKIKKLEETKRKIEQDLTKRSANPDPKAAIGDNNANSAVNRRILGRIESQINVLESRRDNKKMGSSFSEINNNGTKPPQYPAKFIDISV